MHMKRIIYPLVAVLVVSGAVSYFGHAFEQTIEDTSRNMAEEINQKNAGDSFAFETLRVRKEGAVLFVEIAAPPMNLLGPELVRDLVSLILGAEADNACQVLVFSSADPDYFISHVDVYRIKQYRAEAARLTGEPSIALLFRRLSASRLISIAQIEGRVRGAGSEFALACDMRFAARESAISPHLGLPSAHFPGGGPRRPRGG